MTQLHRWTLLKQLAIVVAGSVVAAAMVTLGIWQLRVYAAQGLEAARARATAPAVPLPDAAPAGDRVVDGFGRSVVLDGRYLSDQQLLVPLAGEPGRLRVLTAFLLTDGRVVPVVRGVVEDPGAGSVGPPAPAAGSVGPQVGVLLPSEEAPAGAALPAPGRLGSVRVPVLAQSWPQPLVEGFVVLPASVAAEQGLEPAPLVLPEGQGRLRNGAYAVQWWIFAVFALVMAGRIARDLGQRGETVEVDVPGST